MIKVVLFDADGVLINGGLASHHFEKKYGINHNAAQDFFRGPFQDCLVGKKDARKVLPPYLKKWGWQKSVDDFLNEWHTFEHAIDKELMKYINKLRHEGTRCYVATNQDKYRAKYMLTKMGFGETFDGMFVSADLGHQKTDRRFFEKVILQLGNVDKDEVLFWDDDEINVKVARDFGFHAEVYTDLADFLSRMQSAYSL